MDKKELLRSVFGHTDFRSGQEELIDSILAARDCLGVMPTGGGKSMCYQIPALMLSGTALVVSPLISLMQDQVESLRQNGVKAAFVNSALSPEETYSVLHDVAAGEIKILYVAPERLSVESFLRAAQDIEISLVAVDEAHCVSHWGQDFRPSYLEISRFISSLKKRPVVAAFTATATDIVKEDIIRHLELSDPLKITTGFDRPNLYFEVRNNTKKDDELLKILRTATGGSTIIYCSTRKNVDKVCADLCQNGYNARRYHAGMGEAERKSSQEDFIFDRCNIMVATNAFGMGIDKSDVSLVIHYNMPKDLESYYQEAGRAGRDGGPARCILLYSGADVRMGNFLIEHSYEGSELSQQEIAESKARDQERLKQMTYYSTSKYCLRRFILKYFGEEAPLVCGNCSSCNGDYDTVDITLEAQKIISCVFRLAQREKRASAQTAAEILHGDLSDLVSQNDFSSLSTFAIMKNDSREKIDEIIRFLIQIKYILLDQDDMLCQTEAAREFIKSRKTLLMKRRKEEGAPIGTVYKSAEKSSLTDSDVDPALLAKCKALRKKLADTLGVPAYVVFTDAALRDMCAKRPQSLEQFLSVSGVGSRKAERYGRQFIEIFK